MRRAVRAEWTKLRTVPSTAWSLVALVGLTVGLGALAAGTDCVRDGCDAVALSLSGVYIGQLVAVLIAVLAVSAEYDGMLIRTTLAADPRRGTVLAAKAVVVTALVLGAGGLAVAGSLLAGRGILPAPAPGPTVRAAAGTVLYLGLVALLSVGIAAVMRHTAAAVTTATAVLYLPLLATLIVPMSEQTQQRVQRLAPMTAGLAVQASPQPGRRVPIGPWAGLGVLAGYAAAGTALGYLSIRVRDA